MKAPYLLLIGILLTGCANGYKKHYTPLTGMTPDTIAQLRAGTPPQSPSVERSPTVPDRETYAKRGLTPIGYSSFNARSGEAETGAIEQGQQVGADLVVIVNPAYTGSVTSQIPISTPTSSTSYTTGSATAYGPAGTVNAFGSSTTTTYANKTTLVPVTTNRYQYGAVYFVKRDYLLGANWRGLSDNERTQLQTNSGLYITSVVDDSPAFRNDILAGDILLQIDGNPIYGEANAERLLSSKRGRNVILSISRNGNIMRKEVILDR